MSFIYNDIELLRKFASMFPELKAFAQQPVIITEEQRKGIMLALVTSLKAENEADSNISFDGSLEFTGETLKNLSALLSFITSDLHPVKFKGHRISYTVTQPKEQTDLQIEKQYINIPPFSVYKEGLIEFLKDLRTKVSDSSNVLAVERIESLIDEANTHAQIKANIEDKKDQATEDKKDLKSTEKSVQDISKLTDEERSKIVLDKIPRLINLRDPNRPGDTPVTVLNLSSKEQFKIFASGLLITQDGAVKVPAAQVYSDSTVTIALFLKYLYDRANKKSQDDTNKQLYLVLVKNLAIGYEINLDTEQTQTQQEQKSQQLPELPLSENQINVQKIMTFAEGIQALLQTQQEPFLTFQKTDVGFFTSYYTQLSNTINTYRVAAAPYFLGGISYSGGDDRSVSKFINDFKSSQNAIRAAHSLSTAIGVIYSFFKKVKDYPQAEGIFGKSNVDKQISLAENQQYFLESVKRVADRMLK